MMQFEKARSELAAAEAEIAQKRAAIQAAQEAENLRRRPLGLLLQERMARQQVIHRNKSNLAAHATDEVEFQQRCDGYFDSESSHQSRMYNFLASTYHASMAQRACEILSSRLEKAEKELAAHDKKILALAKELSLSEMLPDDLRK